MKHTSILALFALPLLMTNCNESKQSDSVVSQKVASVGDVSFAKSTFESLARGDSSVATKIDWPVFTSMGDNVGGLYSAYSSAVEKDKFVAGFITQFATSFRENGGSIDGFTNWRLVSHDSVQTEVAADSASGVLTVIVAKRDGAERVVSINMIK